MKRTRTLTALSCGLIPIAAIAATGMTASAADEPDHAADSSGHTSGANGTHKADLQKDLAQVRRATARFHDLDTAKEAGYELGWVNGSGTRIITGCVASPTSGAMGYHYFNAKLMTENEVNLLEPEVLVYATGDDGALHLVAVEWAARGPNSNPPGPTEPPTVLGQEMHILVPAVGFYLTHAWVWKPNPAGMLADWNPNVTCP